MTVKEMIDELKRLPEQTQLQPVKLLVGNQVWSYELTDVVWNGGNVTLEGH